MPLLLVLVVFGLTAACTKPPLEDIASAEAALQAARDAEAPRYAAKPFAEAKDLMDQTYRLNEDKDYENTRKRAHETQEKAAFARDEALKRQANPDYGKKLDAEPQPGSGNGGAIDVNTPAETAEAIESEEIGKGALDDGSRLESLDAVLFSFDRFDVAGGEMAKVEAAAAWLNENPSASLRIEGHTDERGAADYNFALGTRRAASVRDLLVALGVDASRIDTRSYGEETPADLEHDEAAWAKNRRDDFVITR